MSKPLIAITMGDPTGVGPEIIVKTLAQPEIHELCRPLVLGDEGALTRALTVTGASLELEMSGAGEIGDEARPGAVRLLPLSRLTAEEMECG